MVEKPYHWQMIKEAVENLNGKATYGQIKSYIKDKYGEVNENSLNAQITVFTLLILLLAFIIQKTRNRALPTPCMISCSS